MGRISTFTLQHLLDINDLREIRNDWAQFYIVAYRSDEFEARYGISRLDVGELNSRAITAMERAGSYRPHEKITGTVERIARLQRLLQLGLLLLALIGGSLVWGVLEYMLTITSQLQTFVLSSIPIDLWVLAMAYLYLLKSDDVFVQELNKKLRFGADDIARESRDSERLFAYYLWNDGLCNPKKAPVLMILLLIKNASGNIYQHIIDTITDNLERFIDTDNYRSGIQTAYEIEMEEKGQD